MRHIYKLSCLAQIMYTMQNGVSDYIKLLWLPQTHLQNQCMETDSRLSSCS